MRQRLLSDTESVDWLCAKIIAWGEKLRAWGDQEVRPERLSVQSESFSAELSLIPDFDKQDGSLAIDVRLKPRGPGRHRNRLLLVSWGRTVRRLDYAKPWRIAAGRITKNKRRHRRLLDSVHLGREIYWTEKIPGDDLKAQVVLALAQLGCLTPIPFARDGLAAYVRDTFRVPVPGGVPKNERQQAKAAVALLSADSILNRWSFPEDCRAFRKYVVATVRIAARDYFRGSEFSEPYLNFRRGNRDDDCPNGEPSWDPREDEAGSWRSSLSALGPKPQELKDAMTVEQAAQYLNCSKGYIYRLIREGRIATNAAVGSRKLLREVVARLKEVLAVRRDRQRKCKELETSGKSLHAARKAILRDLGSAPKI